MDRVRKSNGFGVFVFTIVACARIEAPTAPPAVESFQDVAEMRRRSSSPVGDLVPQCADPVPLAKRTCRAPGYLVAIHPSTESSEVIQQLATKYHFSPITVWGGSRPGFWSELTANAVSGLRCEVTVKSIEENAFLEGVPGTKPPCL